MKMPLLQSTLLLLLWILFLPNETIGQDRISCDDISFYNHYYVTQSNTANKDTTSSYFYEMPFKIKKGMVLMEAKTDQQTGYFIVDTGIENIILNDREKTKRKVQLDFYDVNCGQQWGQVKNIQLQFGNWSFKNQKAYLLDLSHLEKTINFPIMGLIGMKILEQFEVHFDYPNFKLHVYQLDKKGNTLIASTANSDPVDTIPIFFREHLPYIKTKIGKRTYKFGLDSGAGINILASTSSRNFQHHLTKKSTKITHLGCISTCSKTSFLKIPIVVGSYETSSMPFLIKNPTSAIYQYLQQQKLDGLLGSHFLSLQITALNFRKKQLYLWERKAIKKVTIQHK